MIRQTFAQQFALSPGDNWRTVQIMAYKQNTRGARKHTRHLSSQPTWLCDNGIGSLKSSHVTTSLHGGVVSEPLYVK